MSGLSTSSNLTSVTGFVMTRPQPRPVHFEFDFTKTSTFYLDIWTLLATLGLLVIVALVNAVVFLTWRRQYRNNMAGNTHDVHGNNFYVPNSPASINVIDVGKSFSDEDSGMNSVIISPSNSSMTASAGGVGSTILLPVTCSEWPPRASTFNYHTDKRIILQVVNE
ncbi:uncharacterized protein LOC129276232 [Lytechinus pictus]|uniref:uncharacterized protein LOC129276232 n=1 Tax=Lytechinus pictus TaxID=7653 RepID=UPI00240D53C3|nr:uncharacterized protein LOC129276232 [Lytechinus pictus]